MYAANIGFDSLPDIGFAISHSSARYRNTYGKSNSMSIEIAYITSGCVRVCFENEQMYAETGSIIVLFRHIPVHIETVGNTLHTHLTVLGEFESYDFSLAKERDAFAKSGGLTVPFVTSPCKETQELSKVICRINSDMTSNREENALSCSISFLSVLSGLSDIYKKKTKTAGAYERLVNSVKEYVKDNIGESLDMNEIALFAGKSKSHIAHAFKAHCGMTVKEYINSEKVKRVAILMRNENFSFADALEDAGIPDESYGYRLFRRYTGVTPGQYMSVKHVVRDK